VLGPALHAGHLAAVSGAIVTAGLNIDRIDRLSGRTPLASTGTGRVCVELAASGTLAHEDQLRATLMGLTRAFDIDVAFQHDTV
jgi:phosphoserine phosphatase